jgi:hypothetical protein
MAFIRSRATSHFRSGDRFMTSNARLLLPAITAAAILAGCGGGSSSSSASTPAAAAAVAGVATPKDVSVVTAN